MKSLQPTPPVEIASAKPPALQVAVAQTSTDWEVAHQLLDEEHFLEDPDLEVRNHTRNFLSSLSPGDDLGKLTRAAGVIRNHWGIENKNHYNKDTCQWVEDDHRHRRVNAAQNLALTRNALLAIIPFDETKNLGSWLDTYQSYPAQALKLIQQARPI